MSKHDVSSMNTHSAERRLIKTDKTEHSTKPKLPEPAVNKTDQAKYR